MHKDKTFIRQPILAQIIKLIPKQLINLAVQKHDCNKYYKTLLMAFSKIARNLSSLCFSLAVDSLLFFYFTGQNISVKMARSNCYRMLTNLQTN